jgi:hypothetical protein
MPFRLIPDFDDDSREGARCSVSGTIKQPGDPGVFRGPLIEMEGYFDVAADVIREAACDLGMITEDQAEELRAAAENLQATIDALDERVAELTARTQQLILMNAELLDEYEDIPEDD